MEINSPHDIFTHSHATHISVTDMHDSGPMEIDQFDGNTEFNLEPNQTLNIQGPDHRHLPNPALTKSHIRHTNVILNKFCIANFILNPGLEAEAHRGIPPQIMGSPSKLELYTAKFHEVDLTNLLFEATQDCPLDFLCPHGYLCASRLYARFVNKAAIVRKNLVEAAAAAAETVAAAAVAAATLETSGGNRITKNHQTSRSRFPQSKFEIPAPPSTLALEGMANPETKKCQTQSPPKIPQNPGTLEGIGYPGTVTYITTAPRRRIISTVRHNQNISAKKETLLRTPENQFSRNPEPPQHVNMPRRNVERVSKAKVDRMHLQMSIIFYTLDRKSVV
jgi:hypothetical protein